MARRPGEERFSLSPRGRRIAGWVAAIALVVVIAAGVRIVGGSGEGSPGATDPSSSAVATDVAPITFGTALDPETGLVATPTRTSRFEAGETFAYSVRDEAVTDATLPAAVYVEVERVDGGPAAVVQPPAVQAVAADALAVAFTVPVDVLLEAFGPGEYRMRMYLDEAATSLVAEGTFVLVAARPSASP